MARNQPCLLCKQRRRKCEREQGSNSCKRCTEKNVPCHLYNLSTKSYDYDESLDEIPTMAVITLYEELLFLKDQIRQLGLEIKQEKALVKKNKEPVWTIHVVNGKFQLATQINTLEEFLLYGKSAIKYLSPFGNTFQTTRLEFKQNYPSLLKTALQAISKFHHRESAASKFTLTPHRITKPLDDVYKQLIDNYFYCFNDAIPILHEPSYREHLKNLADPMTDPVTLGICASSSILTCKHSILGATEKRYFGELFYQKAADILLEIFDEPERAFESLLVISLLRIFSITTLRFEESRRWGSIGQVLCRNLHEEVGDFTKGGAGLPKGVRIKHALLHRNYAITQCYMDISDFIHHTKSNVPRFSQQTKFDILPDESPKIQTILQMINHVLDLSLHPAFTMVVTQSRIMAIGGNAHLSFEEIIRYEETVVDWWRRLPESLKICPEPLSLTTSMIDHTTDTMKLLTASYFYVLTLTTQALLVQPTFKANVDSLSQVIRERGIHFTVYSADMLLQLAKRIEALDTTCYSPQRLLVCSIDALMSVIQLDGNESTRSRIDAKLSEYLCELRKKILPDDLVVPEASPFYIISSSVPPGETPSLIELYKDYPLPGEALMFDIIQTTVERTRHFVHSESS